MRTRMVVTVVLTMAVSPSGAVGQESELVLSGGRVVDGRGAERSGVSLSPALGWSDGRSSLTVRGAGTLLDAREVLWSGAVGGSVRIAGAGPVAVAVLGAAEAMTIGGWRGGAARVSPRVELTGTGWRLSGGPVVGISGERTLMQPTGALLPSLSGPAEEESRTRSYRGASADGRLIGPESSLAGRWSAAWTDERAWQEIGVGGTVSTRGTTFGAEGGVRLGDSRAAWGGASLAVPLGAAAAVVLEGGLYPSDPLMDRPGGRYATVGLRVRQN